MRKSCCDQCACAQAPSQRCLATLFLLLLLLLPTGCHHKKPINPSEPVGAPPSSPGVEQPAPPQPPQSEPPQPKRPVDTRPVKPRVSSPGDTAALKLVQQGIKEMNAGDLDSAEQIFEQALRISPSYARPNYYLGVLSYKRGDYKRSLAFLEQAETYSYGDDFWLSQVLLHEGLCLKVLNLKNSAKKKFELALEKDPTNEWAEQELKKLANGQ